MPDQTVTTYAVAFFDGQNLFQHAKAAFGHFHPNYDPRSLASAVCESKGWRLTQVRFYTGIPTRERDPRWHDYWTRRLTAMHRAGINVTKRYLRYHEEEKELPDGTTETVYVPREKGIDLRLALDVVRMARTNQFDAALIFSQDQDLAEMVDEVGRIAKDAKRNIKIACAFPDGPTATSHRGIDRTEWIRLDEDLYNANLDPRDYRPSDW